MFFNRIGLARTKANQGYEFFHQLLIASLRPGISVVLLKLHKCHLNTCISPDVNKNVNKDECRTEKVTLKRLNTYASSICSSSAGSSTPSILTSIKLFERTYKLSTFNEIKVFYPSIYKHWRI